MDLVARGRAASLATFSICARKIRVIRGPKLGGLEATNFSLSSQIRKIVVGTAHPEKNRNLDFHRDLLSCLRPVTCNDALQLAPHEA
jgi:hypothetical protein